MSLIRKYTIGDYEGSIQDSKENHNLVLKHWNYENALFIAFSYTLELLKVIHEEKGENSRTRVQLRKRVLVNA